MLSVQRQSSSTEYPVPNDKNMSTTKQQSDLHLEDGPVVEPIQKSIGVVQSDMLRRGGKKWIIAAFAGYELPALLT